MILCVHEFDAASCPHCAQNAWMARMHNDQPKRLVLEYVRDSAYKGINQVFSMAVTPPTHVQGPFQVGDGPVVEFASLIRVNHNAAYYREVVDKSALTGRLGDFMPGKNVGDFDPAQV